MLLVKRGVLFCCCVTNQRTGGVGGWGGGWVGGVGVGGGWAGGVGVGVGGWGGGGCSDLFPTYIDGLVQVC